MPDGLSIAAKSSLLTLCRRWMPKLKPAGIERRTLMSV
jgi:hypothetical protein